MHSSLITYKVDREMGSPQFVLAQTISTLRNFGLTDYEARSYAALLRHGIMTARRVAETSRIPRPLVYAALKSLNEKGLVTLMPESVAKYAAVPVAAGLKRLLDERRRSIETLNEQIQDLEEQLRMQPEDTAISTSHVEVYHGRINVRRIISRLITDCRSEIRFVTTNPTIAIGESWKNRANEHLISQLLVGTSHRRETFTEDPPASMEVRYADNLRLNLVIVDRSKAVILDMDARNEPQRAILMAHQEVVTILSSIVDLLWDTAATAIRDQTESLGSKSFSIIKEPLHQAIRNGIESSMRTILWSCWNEDQILKFKKELIAAAQRNVDIRIITRLSPKGETLAQIPNSKVRWVKEQVPFISVFDDKCIFVTTSDKDSVQGLLTDHQGFAAAMGFWFMSFEH